jgi:hypothetical protein
MAGDKSKEEAKRIVDGMDAADGKRDGVIHKQSAINFVQGDAAIAMHDYSEGKLSKADAVTRLQVDIAVETALADPKTPNIMKTANFQSNLGKGK